MSILSWLTGRSSNQKYVAADPDKAEELSDNIKKIASTDVATVKEDVAAKIGALNSVIANAGLELPTGAYDGVFNSISEQIESISTQFTKNIEDIKVYDSATGAERFLSTAAMAGAKFGEGVLSVGEDFGDGVLSLVGWVAPKDSKVEKWCTKAIEKNWSHDAFNFYYNSEFAKKSAFTEDSAIAGGFKLAGEVTTFLFVGGAMAGSASVASTSSRAIPKVAGKMFSSTTRANTFLAAQTGLGRGTESGIQSGKSIDEAVRTNGLKTATIDAALIYAGGKWSEHLQKKTAIKAAKKEVDAAKNSFTDAKAAKTKASEVLKTKQERLAEVEEQLTTAKDNAQTLEKRIADGKYRSTKKIKQYRAEHADKITEAEGKVKNLQKGVSDAEKALSDSRTAMKASIKDIRKAKDVLKSSESATYQGYTDKITKAGQNFGKSTRQGIRSSRKVVSTKITEVSAKRGANKVAQNEAKVKTAETEATKAEQTFKSATNKLNKNEAKIKNVEKDLTKARQDLKNGNYKSKPKQKAKIRHLDAELTKAKKATPQLVKEKASAEAAHNAAQSKLTKANEALKSSKGGPADLSKAQKASQKAVKTFKKDVASHPVTKAASSAKGKVTGGVAKLKSATSTTKTYVKDTAATGKDALSKTIKAKELSKAGSSKAVTMSGDAAAQRANFVDALKKPVNRVGTSIKGKVVSAGESLTAGVGKLKNINGATIVDKAGKGVAVVKENAPRIITDSAAIGVGISKTDTIQNLIGGGSNNAVNNEIIGEAAKPSLQKVSSDVINQDTKQDYPGIDPTDNDSYSSDYSNNSSSYSDNSYSSYSSSTNSSSNTENTDTKTNVDPSKEEVQNNREDIDLTENTENTVDETTVNTEENEAIDLATSDTNESTNAVQEDNTTTPEVTNTAQEESNPTTVSNTQKTSTSQVSYTNDSSSNNYVESENNYVSRDNYSKEVQENTNVVDEEAKSVDSFVGINEENIDQVIDDDVSIDEIPEEETTRTTITSDSSLTNPKTSNSSGGSSAIPIIAGVGAAVAAGAGAKIYMDNKKNNDNDSYDENWSNESEEETDTMVEEDNTVVQNNDDFEDDQFAEPVKYSARNTEELSEEIGGYNG